LGGTRTGAPKEIIAKVNADMTRILALPDMKEREITLGYHFIGGQPEKLAALLKYEVDKWAEVAKSSLLK
jgi:tripartite-type tricarboxylate transporter receptor subunit TctC